MNDLDLRQARLRQAHFLIRAELVVAFVAPAVTAIYWISAPGTIEPMFLKPSLIEMLIPWVGGIGVIVGIAWMLRLSRPDPEAGERSWRYRDF